MTEEVGYLEGLIPIIGRDSALEILDSSERNAVDAITVLKSADGTSLEPLKQQLHILKGIAMNLGLKNAHGMLQREHLLMLQEARELAEKIPELFMQELGDLRTRLQAKDP